MPELTQNEQNFILLLRSALANRPIEPAALSADADSGSCYPANALMTQGLPMPTRIDPLRGVKTDPTEYQAFQIHLVKQ